MKVLLGDMLNGIKDIIIEKAGRDSLNGILQKSGADYSIFSSPKEAPTKTILEVLDKLCEFVNIPVEEAVESYGEYWGQYRLPKMLPFIGKEMTDSRSFLLNLNQTHFSMSASEKVLPIFKYDWKDNNILLLTWKRFNEWENIPCLFFKGMVGGAAKFYKEELRIFTGPSNSIIVVFPDRAAKRRKIRPAESLSLCSS